MVSNKVSNMDSGNTFNIVYCEIRAVFVSLIILNIASRNNAKTTVAGMFVFEVILGQKFCIFIVQNLSHLVNDIENLFTIKVFTNPDYETLNSNSLACIQKI